MGNVPDSARFPPDRAVTPDTGPPVVHDWRPFFLIRRRTRGARVLYLIIKALISGVIVAAVSEIARRFPGWGGLLASLPLVSVLAMTWLYVDTRDTMKVADLASSTFWFFLPSMPMFLIIPALLRSGWSWPATMALAIAVTLLLYAGMFWIAPKLGIRL